MVRRPTGTDEASFGIYRIGGPISCVTIDIMHTERNVFMSIFNTVMDIKGKTKDTVKGRYDMANLCHRSELEIKINQRGVNSKPKATFVLSKPQRLAICR